MKWWWGTLKAWLDQPFRATYCLAIREHGTGPRGAALWIIEDRSAAQLGYGAALIKAGRSLFNLPTKKQFVWDGRRQSVNSERTYKYA